MLRACGHLEVTRLGDTIVARTDLGRDERVIIAGHLDTVPIKDNVPSWLSDDGTEVIGRGAVDMKSGVAVHLALAVELASPTRDVTWVFYDNEEVEASRSGLGRVVRERPDLVAGDFAILGEPTSAVIEGGCNGTLRCEVTVHGTAAHSARSWKGVNAIHLAAPLLTALSVHEAEQVEVDGLMYREGLNAVGVSGGIAGNVIPDACTVTINYRFAPGKDVAAAKQRVVAFIDDAYEGTDVDARRRMDGRVGRRTAGARRASRSGLRLGRRRRREPRRRGQNSGGQTWPALANWESPPSTTVREIRNSRTRLATPSVARSADIHACHAALKAWLTA